jgi:hypothetical protein
VASNFNNTTPAAPAGNTNVKFQTDGAGNDSAYVPSVLSGGTNVQTAGYTILPGDVGKNVVANDASPLTFLLPSVSPSATWNVFVQNIGAGTLTLSPNGLNIDGSASSLTLTTNQGVYVSTDGTNYFTERGLSSGGFSNPMTTLGDIIIGGSSGTPTRLGIGSSTQVLTVSGGSPAWAAAGASGVSSLNTLTGALTIAAGTNITVVPSGGNTLTINSTGGGGGTAFQSLQRQAFFIADGTTTTLQVAGDVFSNSVATAAAAQPTASIGAVTTYTSGGANQIFLSSVRNTGGINFNGGSGGNYVTGRNIKVQWKGYWGTAANADYWIGMFTGSNTGNDLNGVGRSSDPASSAQVSGVGFRCFNTSLAETVYQAYSGNGVTGLSTTASTGATLDTAEHTFAIIFNDATPNITYYIDGTLVATITTHLPASAAPLWMLVSAHVASAMLYGFGSCYIYSDV